jgi:4-methyl-5(b-hydroxyethyl)-thiazole monophosphate biosynthesis
MAMKHNKVLVPLAPGFEEIEAVTIIDVLRRAEIDVVVAGLQAGPARGAHQIDIATDATLETLDPADFRMIVLPGGMPGATNLREHDGVQYFIRAITDHGGTVAAICAAPIALAPSGITTERTVTSYPGFGDQVPSASYVENRVVIDGPVITSRGPGTALEFALALVERLGKADRARELEKAMLVHRPELPREVPAG